MSRTLKVAVLGCGAVGSQVVRLLTEQSDDLAARVGVPVELVPTDPWEVEKGYQIVKSHYYLPDIEFTAEEMWALFVATNASGGDPDAEFAFRKLAVGSEVGLFETMAGRQPAPGATRPG